MKYFSWILAALSLGTASCLLASEELVAVSIRYLQVEGKSHYGLYLYASNGELIRRLTHPTDAQDTKPIFSADGKSIYFTRSRHNESVPCAIGTGGNDFRQVRGEEADRYRAISASPSFGYDDYDFSNKEPAPVYPLRYPAPDGSVELVYEKFDEPKDGNEDYYETQAKHAFLVDLSTGSKTALASLPGCEGVGNPLKLSAPSLAVFVLASPLRAAFLDRHLNSTDGTAVFGLDLEKRRLVRLGPNWATVIPLPEAAAFYTVTQERYQPLGDGRTVNCSYLERWNADFAKVRFSAPEVALCGGASVYRKGKPSLNVFPEN